MSRLARRASLTVGAIAVAVLIPAGVGLASHSNGRLPAHTTIGGVDVGGLARSTALARVHQAVNHRLNHPITVVIAGHRYATTRRALGVRADVVSAVDEAQNESGRGSWLSRTWHRVVGGAAHPSIALHYTSPVAAKLHAFARHVARASRLAPVDASAAVAGTGLAFTSAKNGLAVHARQVRAAVVRSLHTGRAVHLTRHVVRPKVGDAAYDTVILIHVNENKLYLYEHHKMARVFPVATGQSIYPTPLGHFHVILKRYLPTWVNPHDAWSVNEPETIPPGPSNPLGLRALNLSAPGIRIHGTPSDYSIGYNASHGCIRMHNSDVLQLYPLVPVGTSVFITTVGAYHPL